MSIEDLAGLEVTSVSKRPEALSEAPAAVFIITAEDIRRLGVTSLPEILRLAPNLEVARINAYNWTVTARGFNSPETANKLLVLIDGRSVYEPIGSGIPWPQVNVAPDNIARIEVISGPGGTMWGANAVNGVINVITRDAASTQGFVARASAGVYKRSLTLGYGGKLSETTSYRVFADGFRVGETEAVAAGAPTDSVHGVNGGFRIDSEYGTHRWSVRGNAYSNAIRDGGGDFSGYDLNADWSRQLDSGSTLTVAGYFDHNESDSPTVRESRYTLNLDVQYALAQKGRHRIVWGGELRNWWESFTSYNMFHFADPETTIALGSVFVQDEIALRSNVNLTLGIKAEYNSYSGFDWLPNARIAWRPNGNSLAWAALSRAVRTPNRIERELEADGFLVPSPDYSSETLTALEAGWRAQPMERMSYSLSAFYNWYDDLRTGGITPVTILPFVIENGARGTTYGLEGWTRYEMAPGWRISAGFNLLHKDFELKPGYAFDIYGTVFGQDPSYQAQIRSEWNITDTVELDVWLRSVGAIDTAPVPGYTELNLRAGWRLRDNLELSLNGANLLNPRHLEVYDPSSAEPRYIGRSVFVSLRYGF
ncbi:MULTISPECIES: TonB-dependent siderophore receptor [Asticcacaulis]|uniref:TonB-dependent receptor plug domain-containing protein n=1 Tax=Asticcacaulis TaxID=76890 RepID=UPI001AE77BCF|nr:MULTISPECIES: TonB-dependent receptor [Asticcacaulis]MBP2159292.1 iron complex outermembrane receptor protein [Asticcacaulis solisilvae]MDR6800337.1 iron complex outermembrane receptor protein [Asticcacaulis sp. BE141]